MYRCAFMSEVILFKKELFVWVDETGCDKRDQIRRYGYALRGERPVHHRFLDWGKRVSVITAITSEGVLALELTLGTVSSLTFYVANSYQRCSHLMVKANIPYLIVDNCAIHHVQAVKDLLQTAGILYSFLPPYSPDLNPAEELFSYVKYFPKDHDLVSQSMCSMPPLLQAAFECYR